MPIRPPRICTCGARVPSGELCACAKRRKEEADKRRPNSNARGYDSRWQKARHEFLRLHPRCAQCPNPSTVVDHIIPHKGDKSLFWRRSNWQALCKPCHDSKTAREDGGFGRDRKDNAA